MTSGYLLKGTSFDMKKVDKEGWIKLHTGEVPASRGGGTIIVYYLAVPKTKGYKRKFSIEYCKDGGNCEDPQVIKNTMHHDEMQQILRKWTSPKKTSEKSK